VLKIALKGRVDRTKDKDYGESRGLQNREWQSLFDLARRGKAGLLVLARQKDVWKDGAPSGRVTHRISDCVYDYADWCANIAVKVVKDPKTKERAQVFSLEVTKVGGAIEELGAVYTSEEWEYLGGPYEYMMSKLYPEDK
jgi:hypothetical protein